VAEFVRDLLAWVAANPGWAYLGIFTIALVESLAIVGFLVPGVIMMVGSGALIAAGVIDFWPVYLWAVAGAVTGDLASYWLGHSYRDRLSGLWPFTRYPLMLETGVRFFHRYGGKSVAFGRFVGPVRAVIPLVAGMMGMKLGRFLFVNVLSAFLWAPLYLLPGILFGASLELAAEAAFHLVVLLLALVGLVWIAVWGARRLFLFYSPRAKGWVEALLRWAEVHPRMGDLARALADPHHPEAGALAALAGVFLLATVVFTLVAGIAVAGASELTVNQALFALAQSLHSPAAHHLMAAFSRLGDLAVLLPLVSAVTGWLYLRGERRHAAYWLAAGAFVLSGPLLAPLLRVAGPDLGLTGVLPWTFPSGHVLGATVVYGFLAVVLAGGMAPSVRWVPYAGAAVLVSAAGAGRLYFGLLWFTDLIGSLTLGLAWVAALGLAYRRHWEGATPRLPLALLALVAAVTAFGLRTALTHGADLARYRPPVAWVTITDEAWRGHLWRALPQSRDDLGHTDRHPLNLQYAGSLEILRAELGAAGWEPATRLSWGTAMKLLSTSLPLCALPLIPHVHDGSHEALALVRQAPGGGRLVLRLWETHYRIEGRTPLWIETHYRIEGRTPLWIGTLTKQHKRTLLDLLAIPSTGDNNPDPVAVLGDDLGTLEALVPAAGGPLLVWAESG